MRTVALIVALGLSTAPALARHPSVAPPPGVLLAQIDDSDLKSEETLEELKDIEYEEDAWSMGAAIGLSMLPGGGWGLMYAEKEAQSAVPFLIFAVGTAVGATYLAGVFDESESTVCRYNPSGEVLPYDVCSRWNTYPASHEVDERSPEGKVYYQTKADYGYVTTGEDFDGKKTGVIILASTYLASSLLGAIWAGSTVADHNEQVRKDVESTAQRSPVRHARPVASYDGDQGYFGFALDF